MAWQHIRAGRGVAVLAALSLAAPGLAAEDAVIVAPSGQSVTYLDTVSTALGPEGLTLRFRFLAPAIAREGGTVDAETAQGDMIWLCETYVLDRIAVPGPVPSQVIVSLSDRKIAFGETDPAVTQYFEAYRVDGDRCEWEPF